MCSQNDRIFFEYGAELPKSTISYVAGWRKAPPDTDWLAETSSYSQGVGAGAG